MQVKKKAGKIILGIAAFLAAVLIALTGCFLYTTRYKITVVASSASPDGVYELFFQEVGEADWPFGASHARLVLKKNSKTVAKQSFEIANDGKLLGEELWAVTWKDDCVEVVISGEEQQDERFILYYTGGIERNQLDQYDQEAAESV